METWFSYALSDFLMFSTASYYRRFELANAEFWPAQLVLAGAAIWLLWRSLRPKPASRLWVYLTLAALWSMVATGFLHRHYAQINLVADWFAWGFAAQALLLVGFGLSVNGKGADSLPTSPSLRHPGLWLYGYAILLHPLVSLAGDRSWRGIEWFGVAPDATALATLGILIIGLRAASWPLLLIPFIWCAISALTYLAMDEIHGTLPLLLAAIAMVATLLHIRRHGESRPEGRRSRAVPPTED